MADRLTDRQSARLEEITTQVTGRIGQKPRRTHICLDEETRPGRGHDAVIFLRADDYLVEVHLDVYGNGGMILSRVTVEHNDFDEDCACWSCIDAMERETSQ